MALMFLDVRGGNIGGPDNDADDEADDEDDSKGFWTDRGFCHS